MVRTGLVVAALVAASGSGAMAQSTRADSVAVAEMRAALRNVTSAQEIHYSRHGTYATEFSQLRLRPEVVAKEVTIVIRTAGTRGWNGEATHTGLAGRSCVMEMGAPEGATVATRRDRLNASERPGRVRCDGDAGAP